jgi:hypothetical protein
VTYIPQMVQAQVLWDSLFFRYRSSLAYSGTVTAGFDAVNAIDWRDFTLFRYNDPGVTKTLTVTCSPVATLADTLVVWLVGPTIPASLVVTAQVSADGSTWESLGGGTIGAVMQWFDLAAATVDINYARVQITCPTGPVDFRSIAFGPRLQFPIGQWQDVNPPQLYQGVIMENVMAVNGSILGRNIKRIEKTGKISLTLLEPAWIRAEWQAFAVHVGKQAFFHRWNPVGYPNEVAFAVATEIVAPTNDRPPPRMKVELPMRFITE